jgi:hypothetical protein
MPAAKLPRKAIRKKALYASGREIGPLPEAYLVADDKDSLRPGGLKPALVAFGRQPEPG